MTEWLNCHNPYVQYTHEPDNTMVQLIKKYGFLFDDDFWYWIPKYRGSKIDVPNMVKRSPLWTYPCKSVARESGKPKPRGQKKLLDCIIIPALKVSLDGEPTTVGGKPTSGV